jgi:hypothetical protein
MGELFFLITNYADDFEESPKEFAGSKPYF